VLGSERPPEWFDGEFDWNAFRLAASRRELSWVVARDAYLLITQRTMSESAARTGRSLGAVKKSWATLRAAYGARTSADAARRLMRDITNYSHS